MSRYARKVDANQAAIVAAFRALGASVLHLHTVGAGCPDLLVGIRGVNVLVELKDGSKPPSARRLTPLEEQFCASWRGRQVVVVERVEDVARVLSEVGLEVTTC